jgi:hypothetical protein
MWYKGRNIGNYKTIEEGQDTIYKPSFWDKIKLPLEVAGILVFGGSLMSCDEGSIELYGLNEKKLLNLLSKLPTKEVVIQNSWEANDGGTTLSQQFYDWWNKLPEGSRMALKEEYGGLTRVRDGYYKYLGLIPTNKKNIEDTIVRRTPNDSTLTVPLPTLRYDGKTKEFVIEGANEG